MFSFPIRTPSLPIPRTALHKKINPFCYRNVPQNFQRVKRPELEELHPVRRGSADCQTSEPSWSHVVQPLMSRFSIVALVNTLYKAGHRDVRTKVSVEQQCGSSLHLLLPLHAGCLAEVYWSFFPSFLFFSIPFIIFVLFVLLPVSRNSDLEGHMVGSTPPLPLRYVSCI